MSLHRRLILCVVAVGFLAAPTAAHATEVPPSPLPVVDLGVYGDHAPSLPISLDTGVTEAQSACGALWNIVGGGGRAEPCQAAARPQNKCYAHGIQPNLSLNGTRVSWHPVMQTACYVRNGQTIPVAYIIDVTATTAGTVGYRSATQEVNSHDEIYPINLRGGYDCVRTVGSYEIVKVTWSTSGGGYSTKGSEQVACN